MLSHTTYMANPLQMLSAAKTEVDYECALREQRILNEEFHERKRKLEEAEWAGLQLAQQMETEMKDQECANSLVRAELAELERLKQAQQQLERDDFAEATRLLELEQFEVKRSQRIAAAVAEQDAAVALKLQAEEKRIARDEAMRAKKSDESRARKLNWIEPAVNCEQDAAAGSMRIWVELPGLGQTDIVVKPESASVTVVCIAALSKCGRHTFSFDLKLKSDEAFTVKPQDVKAEYSETSGTLEIRVQGLLMNVKAAEPGLFDKLKALFE